MTVEVMPKRKTLPDMLPCAKCKGIGKASSHPQLVKLTSWAQLIARCSFARSRKNARRSSFARNPADSGVKRLGNLLRRKMGFSRPCGDAGKRRAGYWTMFGIRTRLATEQAASGDTAPDAFRRRPTYGRDGSSWRSGSSTGRHNSVQDQPIGPTSPCRNGSTLSAGGGHALSYFRRSTAFSPLKQPFWA